LGDNFIRFDMKPALTVKITALKETLDKIFLLFFILSKSKSLLCTHEKCLEQIKTPSTE